MIFPGYALNRTSSGATSRLEDRVQEFVRIDIGAGLPRCDRGLQQAPETRADTLVSTRADLLEGRIARHQRLIQSPLRDGKGGEHLEPFHQGRERRMPRRQVVGGGGAGVQLPLKHGDEIRAAGRVAARVPTPTLA